MRQKNFIAERRQSGKRLYRSGPKSFVRLQSLAERAARRFSPGVGIPEDD